MVDRKMQVDRRAVDGRNASDLADDRRKVNEWQIETDLKLDTLREDVDGLKKGQTDITEKIEENTRLTERAVEFAENLQALNTLAKWAKNAGQWTLPAIAAWSIFKGWWSK